MRRFSSGRAVLIILGTSLLCAFGTVLLPQNAYQRAQQLDGTIYFSLRWIYERIHFDPTPIDVAVFGASRAQLAISAPRLEVDLAARGIQANVVNFAVIAAGRNLSWTIVEDLLATKKPRLLVLEVNEAPHPYGHPAFQYVAPSRDILLPPLIGLHDTLYHLIYLPYRNLHMFAAWLAPRAFGLAKDFDPGQYPGKSVDLTHSHRLPTGKWIEMDATIDKAELAAGARDNEARPGRRPLPPVLARRVYADDEVYTRLIVKAAKAHGIPVVFINIPYYSGPKTIESRDFYTSQGQLLDGAAFADQDRLYQGWAHLNRKGALAMTDWLAANIAPLLQSPAEAPKAQSAPAAH